MAPRRKKGEEREIAKTRIATLVQHADDAARATQWDRADRYVALARRIAMRYRLGAPKALRGRFCRRCHAFLVPGKTSRTRLRNTGIVTTCLRCGHARRKPLHAQRATPPKRPKPGNL